MSHICSVECYVSRWIKSFPSPSCACASSVGRQTEDGRKMSKKENSRRCRRDFWPSLTSTAAALSWLAVEYAAALVNAHNPRFLSSIYNWTNLTWICSDIFGLHWLIMNPPVYMEQFWSRMYLCSTRNKAGIGVYGVDLPIPFLDGFPNTLLSFGGNPFLLTGKGGQC